MSEINLYDSLDFVPIDDLIQKVFPDNGMKFSELVWSMLSRDKKFNLELIFNAFKNGILQGFTESRNVFLTILLLGIIAAVLAAITDMFENKQVVEMAYYFMFLLVTIIVMGSFKVTIEIAVSGMKNVVDFMTVLLPSLCLAMTFSTGPLSAYVSYQIMLYIIFAVETVLLTVFIPMTECYVFFAVINSLSADKRFEGIMKLIEKVIGGGLKTCVVLTIGGSSLQTMVSPVMDRFNTTIVQKTISAIPVLGDVSDSAAGVLMGSAALIKGGVGAAALVILIIICIVPLMKLFVMGGALKAGAAILSVLGEKRFTGYVDQIGNGSFFVLKIAFCAVVMFFISIGILVAATGRGV